MKLLDFLDRVREKHEPENAGIFDDEQRRGDLLSEYEYGCLGEDEEETYYRLLHEAEEERDGMLSDEAHAILSADDWEEHGGDPRGEMRD